ncbi:MAG: hypothetical protein ACK559_21025, partial [bacterium]
MGAAAPLRAAAAVDPAVEAAHLPRVVQQHGLVGQVDRAQLGPALAAVDHRVGRGRGGRSGGRGARAAPEGAGQHQQYHRPSHPCQVDLWKDPPQTCSRARHPGLRGWAGPGSPGGARSARPRPAGPA